MRRGRLLHGRLAGLLAELGHTDVLVVADAGLPIPPGVERIDLALMATVPGFLQTLEVIMQELAVESAVVASEMADASPELHRQTCDLLQGCPVRVVPHTELKAMSASARAIVRTGECTPYANVVLVAGVTF